MLSSVSCSSGDSSSNSEQTFLLTDEFYFDNSSPVNSISIYKEKKTTVKQAAYVFEIKPEKVVTADTKNIDHSNFKIIFEPNLDSDSGFAQVKFRINNNWIEKNKVTPIDLEILEISENSSRKTLKLNFVEISGGYHHYTAKITKSADYTIRVRTPNKHETKTPSQTLMPINNSQRNTSSFSTLPRVITNKPSGPNSVSEKNEVEYISALFKSGKVLDNKIQVEKGSIVEARIKVNAVNEISGELLVQITKDYIDQEDIVVRSCPYKITLKSGENTVGNCLFKIDELTTNNLIQYSFRLMWGNILIYEAPEINPIEQITTQN